MRIRTATSLTNNAWWLNWDAYQLDLLSITP